MNEKQELVTQYMEEVLAFSDDPKLEEAWDCLKHLVLSSLDWED